MQVIHKECDNVIASLQHLQEGEFSRETKSDAGSLLNSIQQFPFIALLNFWYPVLSSVEKVSKRLQDPKMGFHEAFCDLRGLINILNLKNEKIIHNAIDLANKYCKNWGIPTARTRRRKRMPGESARDSGLTAQEEINRVMVEIVNRLKTEIEDRSVRLQGLSDLFSFLLNLNSIVIEDEQDREKLRKECSDFANYYDNDVVAIQLYDEIIDFVMLLQAGGKRVPSDPKDALETLMLYGRDVFPTLFHTDYCLQSHFQLQTVKVHFQNLN